MPVYCGCNEKALSSQRAIACALLALMEAEPYADDVVAYILRENHCYSPEPEASSCLKSFCMSYSEYIAHQRHFLTLLVNNGVGHLLYQSIFDSLMDCGCFLRDVDTASRRSAANFTAGALTGVAQDYVAREACTADELCRLLESLFGGSLFR